MCNQRQILTSIFALKVPVIFLYLPAASLHLSLLTFNNHFTFPSTHNSQLSSHTTFALMCSTSLSTFQLCFEIALFICFVCHVAYEFFMQDLEFCESSSHWSRAVSSRHVHATPPRTVKQK